MNARITVGDVEVVALIDAEGTFSTFREAFPGTSQAEEALARESWPELFDGEDWTLPFRCFLLRLPHAVVLVDAGVAHQDHFLPAAQARLLDALRDEGVASADVDVVLLTHLHVDHVGWTVENGEPVFERARYLACGDDVDYFLRERAGSQTVVTKIAPLAAHDHFARFPPVEHEVVAGVIAVPAPGHTPGHVAFELSSRGLLVLGDAAVHPVQLGASEVPYSAEVDPALARATREALLDRAERSGAIVAAGHFPGSGFGRIAADDGGRAFAPLSARAVM